MPGGESKVFLNSANYKYHSLENFVSDYAYCKIDFNHKPRLGVKYIALMQIYCCKPVH